MITQNLPTLKINKLSDAQYEREKTNERLDTTAIYLTPDTSINYTAQTLTDDQKAQARTNIGAVSHTELNTKIANETIGYGSVIQNTNPFGGKKLYINSMDDAFYALDKRAYVTGTIHSIYDENNNKYPTSKAEEFSEDDDYFIDGPIISTLSANQIANLFNGYYDEDSGGCKLTSGQYLRIRIQQANLEDWTPSTGAKISAFGSYPYGSFYLSYYYAAIPNITKRSQYRCYNLTTTGGAKGWHLVEATVINQAKTAGTDVNWIEKITDTMHTHRSCVEFIIFGNDSITTNLIELELNLQRPNIRSTSPIITNFGTNTLYYDTFWKNSNGVQTVKVENANGNINTIGTITATTFNGKLKNALTINNILFDGSSAKTLNTTSVTVGGTHQETFDADTKVSLFSANNNFDRLIGQQAGKTIARTWNISTTVAAANAGGIPYYNPSQRSNNTIASGHLVTGVPQYATDCTNKKYVDDNFVNKAGDTITGDLTITGNLQVKGISETVDAVTYKVENNLVEFNPDKTYNNTWLTGIAVNKGIKDETDLGTYGIMYDPNTDSVKLGFGTISENHTFDFNENESAPIATREEFDDSWKDDEIFVFDKTTKSFKHSGKTLESYKKEIQDEMKAYIAQFVAEYVENYMSSETIVYPDGTTETDSDILYVNGTTTEIDDEDGSTILYVEEK